MAETLNDAIALIRSGNRDSARPILKEIIRVEPHNVSAWLWLVETLPHDVDKIKALEYCVQLNPTDQTAPKALQMLKARQAPAAPSAADVVAAPAGVEAVPESPPPAVEPPAEQALPAEPAPPPVEAAATPFQQVSSQESPVQPAMVTPFQQATPIEPAPPPPAAAVAPVMEQPAPPQAVPVTTAPPAMDEAQPHPVEASAGALPETPMKTAEAVKAATPPFPTNVEPPFIAPEPPKPSDEKSSLPEPVIETQNVPEPRPRRTRNLRWLVPAILVSFLIFLMAGLGFLYIQYVINR